MVLSKKKTFSLYFKTIAAGAYGLKSGFVSNPAGSQAVSGISAPNVVPEVSRIVAAHLDETTVHSQ